jgi:hypothetical protein
VVGTVTASSAMQRLFANSSSCHVFFPKPRQARNHHTQRCGPRFSKGILFTTNSLKSSQRSALRPGKRNHHV